MDFLKMEQILIYGTTFFVCGLIIYFYLRKINKKSAIVEAKLVQAKEEGRFIPLSLHPYIDLDTCIGSGACVSACPEKDILGIVNGKATVINATSCVGHGACFHACPVEAISLRIGTESRGVELPHVNQNYESNVNGIYIAGELGGMGLIKNSVEQGKQAVQNMIKNGRTIKDGDFDLVIIGAGPAGISASLTAKGKNLNFVTLEQDSLGGTVFTFPRTKVVMTNPMDLPLHGKVKLFDTSKRELLDLWTSVLEKNNIKIQEHQKVESITARGSDQFEVRTAKGESYFTANVLIAIGRRGSPRKLNIPGETLPKVAYRLLDSEQIQGMKIIVVGGGDSAIESAMLLMDKNEVTLSYRKDKFARIKQKNKEKIQQAIDSKKIDTIFNSNLVEIKEKTGILLNESKQKIEIENDLVYIFAGGELPTQFLQNAGIEIKKRFGYVMKSHKK
jgi:thioredoxin reductase